MLSLSLLQPYIINYCCYSYYYCVSMQQLEPQRHGCEITILSSHRGVRPGRDPAFLRDRDGGFLWRASCSSRPRGHDEIRKHITWYAELARTSPSVHRGILGPSRSIRRTMGYIVILRAGSRRKVHLFLGDHNADDAYRYMNRFIQSDALKAKLYNFALFNVFFSFFVHFLTFFFFWSFVYAYLYMIVYLLIFILKGNFSIHHRRRAFLDIL